MAFVVALFCFTQDGLKGCYFSVKLGTFWPTGRNAELWSVFLHLPKETGGDPFGSPLPTTGNVRDKAWWGG